MSKPTKVVLIGWHPDVVDYSKWPDLSADKLRAALESDRDQLTSLGYEARLLFIDDADTAYDVVYDHLREDPCDCVLIGAGVRKDDAHFLVFERLVNAAHVAAPQARICFNTNPHDTAAAVERWMSA